MNKLTMIATAMLAASSAQASDVLPFPKTPSQSVAGISLEESTHVRAPAPQRLGEDAPNILIVMFDDAGFGNPSTFGGLIETPTMTALAEGGIAYNSFHTTAQCSPTRAALYTGRNHHRVGFGGISETAMDFDGYTAEIPTSTATIAEVLGHYGYNTSHFGKWHNTPVESSTAMGPFDRWPTGMGYDYFYGFIGGETSQFTPSLIENTVAIEPPNDPEYHLTDDLADKAINWLRNHNALTPDRPFLMTWTPGAVHGPFHVHQEWTDKYKGKFDGGWEEFRQTVFENQKELGWIPEDAVDHELLEDFAKWDSLSDREKAFQARLMEVYAGFLSHTDYNVGRVVDELRQLGELDNTLIFYILSDNGASAEGGYGSINELVHINSMAHHYDTEMQMDILDESYGGLDAIGGPLLDPMYSAAWAWAGNVPHQYTKLTASYFGGTRTPMVVHWPDGIKADSTPRSQFHHVNDIVPTIYEVLDIKAPKVVNGVEQQDMDGVSLAYTFEDANVPAVSKTQYFEIMGSRGVYKDGWMASTFGPRTPWDAKITDLIGWDPKEDVWHLYDLENDFNQTTDVSNKYPEKLEEMKALFDQEAKDNHVYPIGAIFHLMFNPSELASAGLTEWTLSPGQTRIPEFNAPKVGIVDNDVRVELNLKDGAEGVLYAVGSIGGGVTVYIDEKRHLVYEYNQFGIERNILRSEKPLPIGEGELTVESRRTDKEFGGKMKVDIAYNGKSLGELVIPRTTPLFHTVAGGFQVGMDVGSPVSLDYYDKAPYALKNATMKFHAAHK